MPKYLLQAICVLLVVATTTPHQAVSSAAQAAPPGVESTVRQQTKLGQSAYKDHNYKEAAEYFQQALKISSSLSPRAKITLYSNLGAALREQHKYDEATVAFKQAIAIAEKAHMEQDVVATVAMKQFAVLLRRSNKNVEADLMEARATGKPAGGIDLGHATTFQAPLQSSEDTEGVEAGATTPGQPGTVRYIKDVPLDELKRASNEHPDEFGIWKTLAVKYMQLKNWHDAIGVLEAMKSKFPGEFPSLRRYLVDCYYRNDQIQQAIDETKRSIDDNPKDPNPYLQLYGIYQQQGDLDNALASAHTFVTQFPDNREVPSLLTSIDSIEQQKKDAEQRRANPQLKGSYNEQRYNWPSSYFPLKVYVAGADEVTLSPSEIGMGAHNAQEVIDAACQIWQQSTFGKISFVPCFNQQDANIEITFTQDGQFAENRSAAGWTEWSGRGELPKARIHLLTVEYNSSQAVTPERMLGTCLHEIGHALGLDHSASINDIMYPSARIKPKIDISEHDAQRVIKLYTR